MRLLFTALACLFSVSVFGQGWEQTYGGEGLDVGNSVQQTTDGGYIISGITKSFGAGNEDVYLIKTDENGVEQWSRTFGGISHDGGISVQQTTDGGYIIAGITKSFGAGNDDVYLIKTDENGLEQWSQTFGGTSYDSGSSVQQTTDGGYIVTGSTYSFGAGSSDVYLIKTDENGNELWTKTFGGTEGDNGRSVQQTFDGGYIVTGSTAFPTSPGATGSSDVYLIKTDGNGNEQWSQTFGGEENNDGFSVQQTTDGGYIIVGMSYTLDFHMDVYLIKTNFNGIEQWSQVLGGLGDEWAYSGQQTTDGGYIITGYINAAGHGLYLLKTNENGEEQWNRIFGEASKQSYALGSLFNKLLTEDTLLQVVML